MLKVLVIQIWFPVLLIIYGQPFNYEGTYLIVFMATIYNFTSNYIFCFQSAERWNSLGKDAGLHNFELHAFRAAFQMVFTAILLFFLSLTLLILLSSTNQLFSILKVLFRYYPEILIASPTIGRQGKAFRRQQNQRILESHLQHENTGCPNSLSRESSMKKGNCPTMKSSEAGPDNNKGGSVYFFLSDLEVELV